MYEFFLQKYCKETKFANRKFSLCKLIFLCIFTVGVSLISASIHAQDMAPLKDTSEQRDLIDIAKQTFHFHTKKMPNRGTKKVYFSFLPFSTQMPGGGNALVSATTAGFYLGDRKKTSLSTATFYPYLTLIGRFGYSLQTGLWLKKNKWNVLGDTRFLYYPQNTWGLGGKIPEDHKIEVQYKYIRFYQTFLRQIQPYFLAGIGYHIDNHINIQTIDDTLGLQKFTGYDYGTQTGSTSFSTGLSLNILYDGRINAFNPLPGYYANLVYRFSPKFLGSNNNWNSLYLDLRHYIPFSTTKKDMLSFWTFYWTGLNDNTPYLDLPSIGWDPYQQRSGRGFDQNRYRGKGLLYFETEYRKDITDNGLFGYVLFANFNSVTEKNSSQYAYLHMAAGAGLRIKFNKGSGTNIGIDYGVSKGYSAIYFNLGETF